jgi:rare lipoprotein A
MPKWYRNLAHDSQNGARVRRRRTFPKGWLTAAIVVALALTGCHKKKPKTTPQAPQPHVASTRAVPAPVGSVEEGLASWYGPPYHGRQAADGEIYDMEKMTAAHRTLPFQTWVRVTNLSNGLIVEVRITDRGPFVEGRIIDLSKAAARQIQLLGPGVGSVRLEVIKTPSYALASAAAPAFQSAPAPVTAPTSAQATTPTIAAAPASPTTPAPPVGTSAQLQTARPPLETPRQPPAPLPPDTIGGRNLYAVQVGVFAVYENAVRLRDQYSKDYGPAQLVIRQGSAPAWRVLVGSFANEADAQRLAERVRSERQQPVFVVHLDPAPPSVAPAPAARPGSGRKPSPMPNNPAGPPQ